MPSNDNRLERETAPFAILKDNYDALSARLEAVEAERDKWLRIAQRLFKERQSLLHGHTYEPSIDDVILNATILENLQENL